MTYSPLQIEVIKAFGSKELSFGCLFLNEQGYECTFIKKLQRPGNGMEYIHCMFQGLVTDLGYDGRISEILGYIPELFPDVARLAREKNKSLRVEMNEMTEKSYIQIGTGDVHIIPYHPTYKLIDQEESTLVQLLNLFK